MGLLGRVGEGGERRREAAVCELRRLGRGRKGVDHGDCLEGG